MHIYFYRNWKNFKTIGNYDYYVVLNEKPKLKDLKNFLKLTESDKTWHIFKIGSVLNR